MIYHSPSYAITIRLKYGFIGAVDVVRVSDGMITRDITVNTGDEEHGQQIIQAVKQLDDVEVVNVSDRVFLMHLGGAKSKSQQRCRSRRVTICPWPTRRVSPGSAAPFMKTRKRPLR